MMVFSTIKMATVSSTLVVSVYSDGYSSEVTGTQECKRTWPNVERLGAGSITAVYKGTLT